MRTGAGLVDRDQDPEASSVLKEEDAYGRFPLPGLR